jgi:hypothetical protein
VVVRTEFGWAVTGNIVKAVIPTADLYSVTATGSREARSTEMTLENSSTETMGGETASYPSSSNSDVIIQKDPPPIATERLMRVNNYRTPKELQMERRVQSATGMAVACSKTVSLSVETVQPAVPVRDKIGEAQKTRKNPTIGLVPSCMQLPATAEGFVPGTQVASVPDAIQRKQRWRVNKGEIVLVTRQSNSLGAKKGGQVQKIFPRKGGKAARTVFYKTMHGKYKRPACELRPAYKRPACEFPIEVDTYETDEILGGAQGGPQAAVPETSQ